MILNVLVFCLFYFFAVFLLPLLTKGEIHEPPVDHLL